jgi:hypothetical protein
MSRVSLLDEAAADEAFAKIRLWVGSILTHFRIMFVCWIAGTQEVEDESPREAVFH